MIFLATVIPIMEMAITLWKRKKLKTNKNASVNVNSKNDNILCKKNEESPDIGQLYSVVDKSAAKKERHETDLHGSSDISEMYSVVNKKSNKEFSN